MKTHTTNYFDTFIEAAEDCPATEGIPPPYKEGNKTVAALQFELIRQNPYRFTSDDVLFRTFAQRNGVDRNEYDEARKRFFSQGQPCFRASPLGKRYGWGIHSDSNGKIALYGLETTEYRNFVENNKIKKVKAMRNKRG